MRQPPRDVLTAAKLSFARLASDDPVPGVLELPLTVSRVLQPALSCAVIGDFNL